MKSHGEVANCLRTVVKGKDKATYNERVEIPGNNRAYNNYTGQNEEANPMSIESRGKRYFFFAAVAVGTVLWVIGSFL